MDSSDKKRRFGFGAANIAVGLFTAWGVFRLLPTRWWPVDGGAVIVAALLIASGVALVRNARIAERLARIAAAVVLVIGLVLFAALVGTAAYLSGVYAQVGTTGAVIFGLVAALVLPYLVVLPAAELAWLGPPKRRR
jgi:hypothetical protein